MALAASRDGGLWVAVWKSGLFHCKGGRCEAVDGPPGHRQLHAYDLLEVKEGDLRVSIGDGMVLRRHAGEWTEFNQTNGLPFSYITCLAQGPAGEIWAGSQEEGLYVFRAGRFHAVPGMDASNETTTMNGNLTGANGESAKWQVASGRLPVLHSPLAPGPSPLNKDLPVADSIKPRHGQSNKAKQQK